MTAFLTFSFLELGKGRGNSTTLPPTTIPLTTPGNEPYHNIRLPKHIRPIEYDVLLKVNMNSDDVEGLSTIKTMITKPSKYIMIHSIGYRTVTAGVKVWGTEDKIEIKTFHYTPNQYFVIEAVDEFSPRNYSIHFNFSYNLRKDLAGFYLSKYKTKTGEER